MVPFHDFAKVFSIGCITMKMLTVFIYSTGLSLQISSGVFLVVQEYPTVTQHIVNKTKKLGGPRGRVGMVAEF